MAQYDILADAIADAKRVKATALANAKFALEETFQPTLQRMISSRIQEEEGDEDYGDEPNIDIDVNFDGEDEYAPEGEDDFEAEDDFGGEDSEPREQELESLIRELDGEEDSYSMDEGDEMDDDFMTEDEEIDDALSEMLEGADFEDELEEGEEGQWGDSNPSADWGDSIYEDDTDDLQEALSSLFEEEGLGAMLDMGQNTEDGGAYTDHTIPSNASVNERRRLRNENYKLKKNLNEAYRAVTTLKKTLNEVNLLNAKLMFTTKTFKQYNLTESQQSRILDSFDRANNVREVKLVYTTICESFNKKPLSKRKFTEGFASKSINAMNPSRSLNSSNRDIITESTKDKFQRLAGLRRLED